MCSAIDSLILFGSMVGRTPLLTLLKKDIAGSSTISKYGILNYK